MTPLDRSIKNLKEKIRYKKGEFIKHYNHSNKNKPISVIRSLEEELKSLERIKESGVHSFNHHQPHQLIV